MGKSWSDQKSENVRLQAKRQEERLAAQSAQAREYLRRFIQAARANNLPSEPLVAQGYGGKGSAKTGLNGWYLKTNRTMAVCENGDFYLLIADLSWKDRLKGYTPKPTDPPLVLGAGGRDGESIDLTDALSKLLPSWRTNTEHNEGGSC